MAFVYKPLEQFGERTTLIRIGSKLRSDRYQCSLCGVMVGKDSMACGHCGADLR
jgi:hypothetical protein